MADITIETSGDAAHLYEWLQDDPEARKVSLKSTDGGEPGTILAVVNTATTMWSLAMSVAGYRRTKRPDSRPDIWLVLDGKRLDVAAANRSAVDSFFYDIPGDDSGPAEPY
jgi:hypothetical protein